MRIIKLVLGGVLIILLVMSLFSLMLPSALHVEKSRIIRAEPEQVFQLVNDLRQWEHWSPWHITDPDIRWTYSNPDTGKGAWYTWESEEGNVGSGKLTITESIPYTVIRTEMDFGKRGTAESIFTFERVPEGTLVIWAMRSHIGLNPVGKYMGLLMRGMIGSSYLQGLESLDHQLHNNKE